MLLCQGIYQNSRAGSVLTHNKKVIQTRGLRSSTAAVLWAVDVIVKDRLALTKANESSIAPMYLLPYFWPVCKPAAFPWWLQCGLHGHPVRSCLFPSASCPRPVSFPPISAVCPAAQSTSVLDTWSSWWSYCYLLSLTAALALSLTCSRYLTRAKLVLFSLFRCFCHILSLYCLVRWKTKEWQSALCYYPANSVRSALRANGRK